MLFSKKNQSNKQWKLEYIDTVYKIYDRDKNLAGYFFPNYDTINEKEDSVKDPKENYDFEEETNIIDEMNKENQKVIGGNLMLPMIKLHLLDNQEGLNIDYAIDALEENVQRTKRWREWIKQNHEEFKVIGSAIYTAREDRNMLSIVIGLDMYMVLGEKELLTHLKPVLDKLQEDGML
jgi:hypothetical protein